MDPIFNRIKKEYDDLKNHEKETTVEVWMVDDDIRHWKGKIAGASDTPYEGGTFIIDIVIPQEYPFKPPKMKFDTKIWHPNISSVTGAICLDILKNEWTPALTIRTALISLQALMCSAVPSDPQDAEVARQYMNDINAFNATAKNWVKIYATPNSDAVIRGKIKELVEMGFSEEAAKNALAKTKDNNVEQALNFLLGE